ncbi:heat shock protein 67B2, partial [Dichotomocladium elegans]
KGYCLIDVREPGELTQGTIPTSRNIPLSQFQSAWSLSPEEFKQTVGFDKPTDDSKVILYCQAGIRSKSALDFLREIGYKNVLNYAGSWKDYAQRSKQ